MEYFLCSSPKINFTPLPEHAGSFQGWISSQKSEPKGQTFWRVYGFSMETVEDFGGLEYWCVNGGVKSRTPSAKCLKMSLLRQHRCTTNGGLGWGELILTPFDISYSSKLRIFNFRPNSLWNVPRGNHNKEWSKRAYILYTICLNMTATYIQCTLKWDPFWHPVLPGSGLESHLVQKN